MASKPGSRDRRKKPAGDISYNRDYLRWPCLVDPDPFWGSYFEETGYPAADRAVYIGKNNSLRVIK